MWFKSVLFYSFDDLLSSLEHKLRCFFMKSDGFLTCSNETDPCKTHKGSKDIIKIVHVTSVVLFKRSFFMLFFVTPKQLGVAHLCFQVLHWNCCPIKQQILCWNGSLCTSRCPLYWPILSGSFTAQQLSFFMYFPEEPALNNISY